MTDPVESDTPLLLSVAAEVAYADGSVTAVGLRRELRKAGIEPLLLCGKHYTTLAEIREMERKCRDAQKDQGSRPPFVRCYRRNNREQDATRRKSPSPQAG